MAKLDQEAFSQKSKDANSYISGKITLEQNINLYKNLFNGILKN